MNMTTNSIHPSQLVNLPQNPTVDQAVEYMKTSMDIVDWNLKRARVIRAVGRAEFCNNYIVSGDSYVSRIDGQGLCPTVLKSTKRNKSHEPFKYHGKR